MPILEGLDITGRTAGNAVIEKALLEVRKGLEAGRNLSDPLKDSNVFPGMVTQMIGVGEQTGAMDAMLQKIADFYEDEVDAAVKDLSLGVSSFHDDRFSRSRSRRRRHFDVLASVLAYRTTQQRALEWPQAGIINGENLGAGRFGLPLFVLGVTDVSAICEGGNR